MSLPTTSRLALKEWAVAVNALAKGQQILILRKGGIHRADKEFRVIHPEFVLYPTFEHQKADLIKPSNISDLEATLERFEDPQRVELSYWCRVTDKFEMSEPDLLESITPYHIWTSDYADKRMRWRPKQPLTVALLRVYEMEKPISLPVLDEYGGCKSWVDLAVEVPLGEASPVIDDEAYRAQSREIHSILGSELATA